MTTELLAKPTNGKSLGFYTPAEASRIAQVPQWTVNSWRRAGIVIPSIEWIDEQEMAENGYDSLARSRYDLPRLSLRELW